MDRPEAERQLLQLLRGQDVAEFTLQISFKERHSDPAAVGSRGWHLLSSPVWTVTMSVPQAIGDRTTTSGASFAQAWQRQGLWWRAPPRPANTLAGPDYRQVMSADSIERAENQFLDMVRGDAGGEITITVLLKAGQWITNLHVPGTAGRGATGEGASFAYAWHHDWPWWQDAPGDPRTRR